MRLEQVVAARELAVLAPVCNDWRRQLHLCAPASGARCGMPGRLPYRLLGLLVGLGQPCLRHLRRRRAILWRCLLFAGCPAAVKGGGPPVRLLAEDCVLSHFLRSVHAINLLGVVVAVVMQVAMRVHLWQGEDLRREADEPRAILKRHRQEALVGDVRQLADLSALHLRHTDGADAVELKVDELRVDHQLQRAQVLWLAHTCLLRGVCVENVNPDHCAHLFLDVDLLDDAVARVWPLVKCQEHVVARPEVAVSCQHVAQQLRRPVRRHGVVLPAHCADRLQVGDDAGHGQVLHHCRPLLLALIVRPRSLLVVLLHCKFAARPHAEGLAQLDKVGALEDANVLNLLERRGVAIDVEGKALHARPHLPAHGHMPHLNVFDDRLLRQAAQCPLDLLGYARIALAVDGVWHEVQAH
mmetsp:Transcript_14376/g.56555  ORF Transcript_14376/g.56555 Transcript_14376/m.56555 type:complete len:412 (+) Transcript_14376:1658-2893(+)